jgi:hypothetical protein
MTRLKRVVTVLLLLMMAVFIAWFSFRQGERHVAGPLVIRMANNGCFDCWVGLTALKNTNEARMAILLDRGMDTSASILAEMSLKHPDLIERPHYRLLLRVRDYRNKNGREQAHNAGYDPAEVDQKVDQAIKYLESIHDTNKWGVLTLDEMIDRAEREK